jgi:hypothetical protein
MDATNVKLAEHRELRLLAKKHCKTNLWKLFVIPMYPGSAYCINSDHDEIEVISRGKIFSVGSELVPPPVKCHMAVFIKL